MGSSLEQVKMKPPWAVIEQRGRSPWAVCAQGDEGGRGQAFDPFITKFFFNSSSWGKVNEELA